MQSDIKSLLHDLATFLAVRGIRGYVVGGTVRDILLGRKTVDIDITIGGDPFQLGPDLARSRGGAFVPLDAEDRIARVVIREWQIDIASLEGEITLDLCRRDFTVNAMAIELALLNWWLGTGQEEDTLSELVLDPHEGLKDLAERIIRMVRPECFTQDPSRLLRAYRLQGELGFTINPETRAQIVVDSHLIDSVPGEKQHEELLKIFALEDTGDILLEMDKDNLLGEIFPELILGKGVLQPVEHYWDVFHHSIKAVDAAAFTVHRGKWLFADGGVLGLIPWRYEVEEHFSGKVGAHAERYRLLKLAGLLHDIAKPQTKAQSTDGKTHFLGHARIGAEMAKAILGRLRFSNKETELVSQIVCYHMRPTQLSQAGLPTKRAIYRFFRDANDVVVDTLFFSLADHLASRGPNLDIAAFKEHAELVSYLLEKYYEPEGVARLPRLVNGHDLMRHLDLTSGPLIGRLLDAIHEAQAVGEIESRDEALSYAEKIKDSFSTGDPHGDSPGP